MKEIGGYIELDTWKGGLLHEGATALNCGRNCLAYLIEARHIEAILLPYFLCTSVSEVCEAYHVRVRYYHIGESFLPDIPEVQGDEWLYLVNYYGQLTPQQIAEYKAKYERIIVDNAQAYFEQPYPGVDTLYTSRKFFGVSDGAFLYTDARIDRELPEDRSGERMSFLLGRFEGSASEYYQEYAANNRNFSGMEIRRMSRLTENLLRRVDYDQIRNVRRQNFELLHEHFHEVNPLKLTVPDGAFSYPLYTERAAQIRKKLVEDRIYIPLLWPNVTADAGEESSDSALAENILPLPLDQRYGREEMEYLAAKVEELL